jgi:hypothetical protein
MDKPVQRLSCETRRVRQCKGFGQADLCAEGQKGPFCVFRMECLLGAQSPPCSFRSSSAHNAGYVPAAATTTDFHTIGPPALLALAQPCHRCGQGRRALGFSQHTSPAFSNISCCASVSMTSCGGSLSKIMSRAYS